MSKDTSIITEKEREVLVQFKENIEDILVNFTEYQRHDLSLLRWLRARELDVNKAEKMLRKSVDWRVKENMDNILEWKKSDFIESNFPIKVSGFDKDGCAIAIIPFGSYDIRKVLAAGLKSEFLRFVSSLFEHAMRLAEYRSTKDRMITQLVIIVDYEGFRFSQVTSREIIECLFEGLRCFEGNFPETLKVGWAVNTPAIFELFYTLFKPLMSAHTIAKIKVFGSNSDRWRSLLLENIDPDQLPSNFGGSNTSCKQYKVAEGFDVFPVYEVFPASDFIPVTVQAGKKHVVAFTLSKNSKLSWNFKTTDYDIGFSFIYSGSASGETIESSEKNEKDMQVIFECSRTDSHLHLQKGAHVAESSGTYCLVFDNSFSRFRPKNLSYCTHVSKA